MELQIAWHIFLCLYQPKEMLNWIMKTWYMHKELVLYYVALQTFPLYILWDQFVTVHATITIPSNWVPLNVMLVLKMLRLNLLKIVILWTIKVFLGGQPTRNKTY